MPLQMQSIHDFLFNKYLVGVIPLTGVFVIQSETK
jgi:hypothetical protein